MTMRRDPMLDEEERRLAAELARIAPRDEPSSELDARILAMAGRASASPAASRRRPWPVWLGLAASLTAVAGLVWRLEPLLHTGGTVRYEAPARVSVDNDPNGKRQPIDYVDAAAAPDPVPPPPPAALPVAVKAGLQARRAPPEAAPAVATTMPSPPAPPPAPTQPPPNAAARADAAASAKPPASDQITAQEVPRRAAPVAVEAAIATPASARNRQTASQMQNAQGATVSPAPPPPQGEDRAGFDARPPATADMPEVQSAWLARIRELRDAGEADAARESLAAFARRYPGAVIPADLKPLVPAPASLGTP